MFLFLLLRPVLSTPNFHSPIRRWHSVHCLEETEAHLSPLVPPHYCAALLLVLLQGHGGWRRVVHDHELLGPCCHVLLLRTACSWFQAVTQVCHVHHTDPNHTDVDGLRSQLLGVLVDAAGPGVSIPHAEHCLVLPHVPQLLCALCPVLLWSLHRQVQIIGYGCHKEKRVKNKCHKYEKKEDNVKREFEIESRDQCLEKWMGLGVREVAYSPRSLVGVGGSWNGWCLCLSIITNVQVFKKNKIKKQKKNIEGSVSLEGCYRNSTTMIRSHHNLSTWSLKAPILNSHLKVFPNVKDNKRIKITRLKTNYIYHKYKFTYIVYIYIFKYICILKKRRYIWRWS